MVTNDISLSIYCIYNHLPHLHEFYSKAACEDAGLAAKKAFEDTGKATLVAWKCVPKGG